MNVRNWFLSIFLLLDNEQIIVWVPKVYAALGKMKVNAFLYLFASSILASIAISSCDNGMGLSSPIILLLLWFVSLDMRRHDCCDECEGSSWWSPSTILMTVPTDQPRFWSRGSSPPSLPFLLRSATKNNINIISWSPKTRSLSYSKWLKPKHTYA